MAETGKSESLKLGFLTSIPVADRGFVGGLLVTNHLGRPLEFQCTAPIRPNRTQEILYGPTLGPFLLVDVIGRTLIEKATVKPTVVLVEDPRLLDLRAQVAVPIACLEGPAPGEAAPIAPPPADALRLKIGVQTLLLAADSEDDFKLLTPKTGQIPKEADLREPFGRVRDALQETISANAA